MPSSERLILVALAMLSAFAMKAVNGLTFTVPLSPPLYNTSCLLDPAPIGSSIEFYTFPAFFESVPLTLQCLHSLGNLFGVNPPIRIGGTTQDRATYNPLLSSAVSYSVPSPTDAPKSLTFGNAFMELAGNYDGAVTIGFNRRLDNLSNTIAAAGVAQSKMPNLYAMELGNEPTFFDDTDPIANGQPWTAAADAVSQVSWQSSVSKTVLSDASPRIQAGVFFGVGPFNLSELAVQEEESNAIQYVRSFSDHYYPQSASTASLSKLMSHSEIVAGVYGFQEGVKTAQRLGKAFVFGETNSVTQGSNISATYGAGLWVLDYVMQAMIMGAKQVFFHTGPGPGCLYCWWDTFSTLAPFYGAYTAALVLSGASRVSALDNGETSYAAYVIYDHDNIPVKILLYNSDYYVQTDVTSTTARDGMNFTLAGIPGTSEEVFAKRLTAAGGATDTGNGTTITIAGQSFGNGSCELSGKEEIEWTKVVGTTREASFWVASAEALLIYIG